MLFVKFSFSLIFPYNMREIPMKAANRQGPAKSPTVLDTPRADSVNADAHCAIVASDAPEQIISKSIIHSSGSRSNLRRGRPFAVLYQALYGTGEKLKDIHQRYQRPDQREYLPNSRCQTPQKREWNPRPRLPHPNSKMSAVKRHSAILVFQRGRLHTMGLTNTSTRPLPMA